MDTVLFLANNPKEAHKSVAYFCTDIQNDERCSHKIFLSQMLTGGFYICTGSKDENGERHMTGEREVLIMPAHLLEQVRLGKNIILTKNCMSIAGESDLKCLRRAALIDWLLDISKLNYAVFGLEDES